MPLRTLGSREDRATPPPPPPPPAPADIARVARAATGVVSDIRARAEAVPSLTERQRVAASVPPEPPEATALRQIANNRARIQPPTFTQDPLAGARQFAERFGPDPNTIPSGPENWTGTPEFAPADMYDLGLWEDPRADFGQLIRELRTPIPYSDVAARWANTLGRTAGGDLSIWESPLARLTGQRVNLPDNGIQGLIRDQLNARTPLGRIPQGPSQADLYGGTAQSLVPREAWELGVEAIPGIGFGPDALRGGRRMLAESSATQRIDDALGIIQQLADHPRGRAALARLGDETGAIGASRERIEELRRQIALGEQEYDKAIGAERRTAIAEQLAKNQRELENLEATAANAPLPGQVDMFTGEITQPADDVPAAPRAETADMFGAATDEQMDAARRAFEKPPPTIKETGTLQPGANWMSADGTYLGTGLPHTHKEMYQQLGAESEADMYARGFVRVVQHVQGGRPVVYAMSAGSRSDVERAAKQLIDDGQSPALRVSFDIFNEKRFTRENEGGMATLGELANRPVSQVRAWREDPTFIDPERAAALHQGPAAVLPGTASPRADTAPPAASPEPRPADPAAATTEPPAPPPAAPDLTDYTATREAFLGTPRVDRTRSHYVAPKMRPNDTYAGPEPFMGGKYTIRRGEGSSVVFDGDTPIALYGGQMLTVAPKYRKQGIAEELVYDYRTKHPGEPPASSRTPAAQRVQERVWKRIELERKAATPASIDTAIDDAIAVEAPKAKRGRKKKADALPPPKRVEPGEMPTRHEAVRDAEGTVLPSRSRLVKFSDLDIDPKNFQKRGFKVKGKHYDETTVKGIVDNYDPNEMASIVVVATPGKPGRYTILSGHHRHEALRRLGIEDVEVRVVDYDISTPQGMADARRLAIKENADRAELGLEGTINAVRGIGEVLNTEDIGPIRAQLPGLDDQEIKDAIWISGLPDDLTERLYKLKPAAPEVKIAAEIGYGVKAYGLTPTDVEGLFRRLTSKKGGKLPTRGTVREMIDKWGPIIQQDRDQLGMFGADDDFGVSSAILDAMDESARLTGDINKQRTQLASDIKAAIRLGKRNGKTAAQAENTPDIRAAKKDLEALDKRRKALEDQFLKAYKKEQDQASAKARATSTSDASGSSRTPEGSADVDRQSIPAARSTTSEPADGPTSGTTTRSTAPDADLRGETAIENDIGGSVAPSTAGDLDTSPLFNPTPEELEHFERLIDGGAWTSNPGARIGAKTALRKLQKGEAPTDGQLTLLYRALGQTREEAAANARKPATASAGGEPPKQPPTATSAAPAPGGGNLDDLARGIGEAMETPANLSPYPRDRHISAYADATDRAADEVNALMVNRALDGLKTKPSGSVWFERFKTVLSPLQLVRTVKTSLDIGWGGRQGWRLAPRNPREWRRMYWSQYRAFVSEDAYQQMQAATKAMPHFEQAQALDRPLAFLERSIDGNPEKSGEDFLSPLTSKIPGLRQSERAYNGPGNLYRQSILEKHIAAVEKANGGQPITTADLQLLVDNLNNGTLRGNTRFLGQTWGNVMGSTLFSLKGQVSGPQYIADAIRITRDESISPAAKNIVRQQVGAYIGMGMSTLALMATTGYILNEKGVPEFVSADLNPKSPSFGEVKVGKMSWNFWGADAPLVRFALVLYHRKQEVDGVPIEKDPFQAAQNFIRSKIAPGAPALMWDAIVRKGRGYTGQDLTDPKEFGLYLADQVAPIFLVSALETYKAAGPAYVAPQLAAEISGFSTKAGTQQSVEPEDKERFNARQYLDESGYSDLDDQLWTRMQERGTVPQGYDSRAAFVRALGDRVEERLAEGGYPPELKDIVVKRVLDRIPGIGTYDSAIVALRAGARQNDPAITRALIGAGEKEATEADIAAILGGATQ